MVIEIVDLPIENADFPWFFVRLPEGHLDRSAIFRDMNPDFWDISVK